VTPVAHFTGLATFPPDRVAELRALIESLPTGAHSPFASVPGTHFARLVVLTHVGADGGPERRVELDRPCVLFGVNCDGDVSEYLQVMAKALGDTAAAVFGPCDGCPGTSDPDAFATWLRAREVPPLLAFATFDAPVDVIVRALRAREQLASFAGRAQAMTPADLRSAWREEFGW
jgi:hypothetical protein